MSYKNAPVYNYSFAYAQRKKEEDEYIDSILLNEKCRDYIELTIESYCQWNANGSVTCTFNAVAAATAVIEQFGLQRTAMVVINTIIAKSYDGRISQENKQWASHWPVFKDIVEDSPHYGTSFVIDRPHSCLFDAFASVVRQLHTK